jgi:hypothetical protein
VSTWLDWYFYVLGSMRFEIAGGAALVGAVESDRLAPGRDRSRVPPTQLDTPIVRQLKERTEGDAS